MGARYVEKHGFSFKESHSGFSSSTTGEEHCEMLMGL